jgi:DNA-binding PucR family transcriptional regulator
MNSETSANNQTQDNITGMHRLLRSAERLSEAGWQRLSSITTTAVMSVPEADHITDEEFMLLCDVANGTTLAMHDLNDVFVGTNRVWDLGALDDAEQLGTKWNVDVPAMAAKLGRWTPWQRLALVAAIDDWWAKNGAANGRNQQ